ncbi:hypothetical protein C8R45DRAFT_1207172 [Mycena sanguinolenta]|nr:hypothetical protein C8R45DRAFT_1207172 [Mycena sanguinolenta]
MAHNHVVHHRMHPRQNSLLDTPPSAAGLTDATTASQGDAAATATALAFNTAAATNGGNNQNVDFSEFPTATFTSPASTSTSDPSSDPSTNADASVSSGTAAVSGGSSSSISMGTVIAACVGAFAGCIFIIFIGLCLYRRGNKPRARSPSHSRKDADKERAWGKLDDVNDDKWEGKDGNTHTQKGVVSVGPMEKLTMFKKGTPSVRTAYTTTPDPEHANLPPIASFDHPFAQYHPGLAEKLAMEDSNAELAQPRPFLARVDPVAPISWDGDTVGRDSFLSLSSNPAGQDLALPTPKLTSSEPHFWESAEVVQFDHDAAPVEEEERGRPLPRKSNNNPFFGARMSTHSTRSLSRSQSQSRASSRAASPEPEPMPAPPPAVFTWEQKGKGREITPPSPRSSTGSGTSTITGVMGNMNPFSDPPRMSPITPAFTMPVVHAPETAHTAHTSTTSHDRALQSLIEALGSNAADVEERLRVASMQPSVMSEVSAYTTETDADTLHQSWPVPPSRPRPGDA